LIPLPHWSDIFPTCTVNVNETISPGGEVVLGEGGLAVEKVLGMGHNIDNECIA
jgi:hypothetical protein